MTEKAPIRLVVRRLDQVTPTQSPTVAPRSHSFGSPTEKFWYPQRSETLRSDLFEPLPHHYELVASERSAIWLTRPQPMSWPS
jgi:hypothetical protein